MMQPLVPIVLSFAAGILSAGILRLSLGAASVLLLASAGVILFCYARGARFSYLPVLPAFFILGSLYMAPYLKADFPPNHIRTFMDNVLREEGIDPKNAHLFDIEGEVASLPEYSGERTRFALDVRRVFTGGSAVDVTGAVQTAVEGDVTGYVPGDTVRLLAKMRESANFGTPGEYDYAWHLHMKGIYVTAYVKDVKFIVKTGYANRWPRSVIDRVRWQIGDFVASTGAANAGALKALIIGVKSGIDKETREAFARTGTSHILVIAGLHVGMVAFFFYRLMLFLLKRSEKITLALNVKKLALGLTLIPVFAYGVLSGFPVSTQRAVIMACALVFTMLLNRGAGIYNVLALAALSILVVEPYAVWEITFQLSFAAVFAIIYIVPRLEAMAMGEKKADAGVEKPLWEKTFRKIGRWVLLASFTTLAATLGTSPVLAYHFHRVALFGVAANILAVPITGFIVPMLLVSTVVMPLWHSASAAIIYVTDVLFSVMVFIIRSFSGLPFAASWVPTPTLLEIALFYLLVAAAVNIKKDRVYGYLFAAVFLAMAVDGAYWALKPSWDRDLRVTFISVGQGDSALVEFPGGKRMLIDGGGLYGNEFDTGERLLAPLLWGKKIGAIDYMVLSHAQRDHMAGLRFIAENFRVKEFWWNGDGELRGLQRPLERNGTAVKIIDASKPPLDVNGVRVEVVHPDRGSTLDQNNKSVVVRLSYGSKSFLFTGDIAESGEEVLKAREIASTVLKAPHHGSRFSSTGPFLEKVHPSIVVISAGRGNMFGFPHAETLRRYSSLGVVVYRTDVNGAVTITTDGENIREYGYLTGGRL